MDLEVKVSVEEILVSVLGVKLPIVDIDHKVFKERMNGHFHIQFKCRRIRVNKISLLLEII